MPNNTVIELLASGKLPGERIVELLIERDTKIREHMEIPENVETIRIGNAMLRGWHNWWVSMGWPGEKI